MLRDRLRVDGPIKAVHLVERTEGGTLDTLVRRRCERSFEEGVAEGLRRGALEAAGRLDRATEALAADHEQALGALSSCAVELALAIGQTLLKREIAAGNYDIESMVRQTLHEAGVGRNSCEVHLHPADYSKLAGTSFRSGTRLSADEGVPLGDVHVETGLGLMVRDTASALNLIKERLAEDLG